ncbi:MAG: hypoxanthine-guanine phosphoribosyltransferase [Gammaproteobacteria bacterium 28-57-27]|nr:MAG: hypoxanthine-guanine phosphoribosyltransferase [Gammaproteobacteria bacterium 28-57-27]
MQASRLDALLASAECLVSADTMNAAYDALAVQIEQDWVSEIQDQVPLVLVVMSGGLVAAGKLLSRLHYPLELDYLHVTRYGEATQGGVLRWLVRPRCSLAKRHVLVVDDIFDEGITLQEITESCLRDGAASVRSVVAVNKDHPRKVEHFKPDYVGVTVEDRFLVGEGMDYRGYFRSLNGIFALTSTLD